MVQQYDIAGEVVIFPDLNDVADLQILPLPSREAVLSENLYFSLVFFLIAFMPLEILYKVFDHGEHDYDGEW